MRKKALSIIALVVILITIISGSLACNNKTLSPDDIAYIEVRQNSLKNNYEVDERIDFSNVYIVIVLKKDRGHIVERVTAEMLEGFDTSTVTEFGEERVMRIRYLGIYTSDWGYTVTSKYDVNSKARIKLEQSIYGGRATITVSIDMDVLPEVYAIKANVSYNRAMLEYHKIEGKIEGWELEADSARPGSFPFVYYAKNLKPITKDSIIMQILFYTVEDGDSLVELTNIEITDAQRDIFLPDASTTK